MQKIIISDTSTIGYLIKINQLELLEKLYNEIIIPPAVITELFSLEQFGYNIRDITQKKWISIQSPKSLLSFNHIISGSLDLGETEAISLAVELKADLLIIDEQQGRFVAKNLGLEITGLVGIFLAAKKLRLINSVKENLNDVINHGCRISKTLYNNALDLANEQ